MIAIRGNYGERAFGLPGNRTTEENLKESFEKEQNVRVSHTGSSEIAYELQDRGPQWHFTASRDEVGPCPPLRNASRT